MTDHPCPMVDRSFDVWWARTCSLAGPLAARLAAMTEAQRASLRERAREAAHPYETPDGLSFPGLALVASGRRPGSISG